MAFILFDEHLGQVHPAGEIRFPRTRASVRELIRARVELEVERQAGRIVAPGPAESALNGDRGAYGFGSVFLRAAGRDGSDIEALVDEAERGFAAGRYFILLDDRQADSLEDEIDLDRTGEATFLLITPLQGG
ncbi:MAG TPA: hypothetical protein VFQ67_01535 [Allosphingosinicella sp.]|jgi:hypothetical protein|nr:hypothetical protein [Allosphingosinicella sp.]